MVNLFWREPLVIRPGDQIKVLDQETGLPMVFVVDDLGAIEKLEQTATKRLSRIVIPKQIGAMKVSETSREGAALNDLDPKG